jgi:hypothetical protein
MEVFRCQSLLFNLLFHTFLLNCESQRGKITIGPPEGGPHHDVAGCRQVMRSGLLPAKIIGGVRL